jgi:RNA recognition motif-containing protein
MPDYRFARLPDYLPGGAMSKRLYVGNLPYSITEGVLQEMFLEAGPVDSVKLITDRDTGRSKGHAFVEMATDEAAERAIAEFGGRKVEGRPMTVNEAKPQQPRPDRGFGGGKRHDFGGR